MRDTIKNMITESLETIRSLDAAINLAYQNEWNSKQDKAIVSYRNNKAIQHEINQLTERIILSTKQRSDNDE